MSCLRRSSISESVERVVRAPQAAWRVALTSLYPQRLVSTVVAPPLRSHTHGSPASRRIPPLYPVLVLSSRLLVAQHTHSTSDGNLLPDFVTSSCASVLVPLLFGPARQWALIVPVAPRVMTNRCLAGIVSSHAGWFSVHRQRDTRACLWACSQCGRWTATKLSRWQLFRSAWSFRRSSLAFAACDARNSAPSAHR